MQFTFISATRMDSTLSRCFTHRDEKMPALSKFSEWLSPSYLEEPWPGYITAFLRASFSPLSLWPLAQS